MRRRVVLRALALALVLVPTACSDQQGRNAPQNPSTGDTLEVPTTGGPASTTKGSTPGP